MKIKSLGYKITDDKTGAEFVITEEAIIGLIEKSYDTFQGLNIQSTKAVKPMKDATKPIKISKHKNAKSEPEGKKIPNPAERKTKELKDLPDEFVALDIINMFVNEGYDKTKITSNIYHDIDKLIAKKKIELIEEDPKKYKIISRDIPEYW